MYKPFIKKLTVNLLSLSIACCPSFLVSAAKTDFDKQIVIKAKRQASDLKNKVASYLDDVFITQGSLSIQADLVQVFSQIDSDDKIYLAQGNPAIFKQLLEDGNPIQLQANEIKYEPSKNTITISGNALVSQEGSVVKGNRIIYNTLTEKLLAESSNNAEDSVTTILKPKNKGKP
jgi:lipopolysaccharide export system protein LptA